MDIHRCRFVPYRPQSINTLAFSHPPNPKQSTPSDLRLALGRENGDVEVWNPQGGNWAQEKILRGGQGRTIEQLIWTQDLEVDEQDAANPLRHGSLRLFSSGGSPSLTEWDLATGSPKRHAEGNVGDIWCFAAQPQWRRSAKESDLNKIANSSSQLLAAGCADGTIILFTTADDSLQFLRVLTAATGKKDKVISITWRDRNTVVAGYERGLIRVVDVPNRTVSRTMTLGKSFDGSVCVVWALHCLFDGTILSGDSSGELKFWDKKNLSLTQRLKAHDADILNIASNSNGNTIFTAGVDRRVALFKQIPVPAGSKGGRWQRLAHRRFHQHDVKSLASFESKNLSVLVSGGMDTVPIVMSLRNWESDYHRSLSHLPHKPQMSCSSRNRLMLTWWHRSLLIWRLPRKTHDEFSELNDLDQDRHQLLARIELQGDDNITSAQISEDGRMIVAATTVDVKLFEVKTQIKAEDVKVRSRPIDLPIGIRSNGASSVGFSPDSKWLFAVRSSNLMTLVKIVVGNPTENKPDVIAQVIKLSRKGRESGKSRPSGLANYLSSISCVSFSSDSRILATGDLSGGVDTWVLEGHEDLLTNSNASSISDTDSSSGSDSESDSDSDDESDSRVIHGQKWIRNPSGSALPRLDSTILALSFKPQPIQSHTQDSTLGLHATRHNPHPVSHELPPSDTKLIAITSSHQITEFDVMSSRLSDWSRRNPSTYLPQSFTRIKERVMGIFWDCDSSLKRERMWLYGSTWLFMLDMTRDLNLVDVPEKVGQIGDYEIREPVSDSMIARRAEGEAIHLPQGKKRKRNTGAGDKKKPHESLVAVSQQVNTDEMEIDAGLLSPESDNEEGDDDIDGAGALSQLRRKANLVQASGQDSDQVGSTASDHEHSLQPTVNQSPAHHAIFRYRSIFGIAALQKRPFLPSAVPDPDSEPTAAAVTSPADGTNSNLEIILVERPIYDIDLAPRFDSGQEWST